jgi:hypothetical protein
MSEQISERRATRIHIFVCDGVQRAQLALRLREVGLQFRISGVVKLAGEHL